MSLLAKKKEEFQYPREINNTHSKSQRTVDINDKQVLKQALPADQTWLYQWSIKHYEYVSVKHLLQCKWHQFWDSNENSFV